MKKLLVLTCVHLFTLTGIAQTKEFKQTYTAVSEFDILNKHTISYSYDARYLAFGSKIGEVTIYDMNTGQQQLIALDPKIEVTVCAFHPSQTTLVIGGENGTIRIYDFAAKSTTRLFTAHDKAILHIEFSDDGKTFFTSAKDMTIKSWHMSGNSIRTYNTFANAQTIHTVGNKLYYSTTKLIGSVGVLDINSGAEIQKLNTKVAKRMDVTDDGNFAAIIGMYKEVQIWNLSNNQVINTLNGHTKSDGMEVKFSKDGSMLATTNGDKTCIIWDMKTKSMIKQLSLSDYCETLAFSGDNKWLAIVTNDKKVFIYKIG